MHTYARTHMHTCTHAHIHTCTHAPYTHMHTHTHTCIRTNASFSGLHNSLCRFRTASRSGGLGTRLHVIDTAWQQDVFTVALLPPLPPPPTLPSYATPPSLICHTLLPSHATPSFPHMPHPYSHQLQQYSISAYHAHTVQSFMQSLSAVVEAALHNVYCPLGGLVQLAGLWYKVFQQHSHRVREDHVAGSTHHSNLDLIYHAHLDHRAAKLRSTH